MRRVKKSVAIRLMGGSVAAAAEKLKVTRSAISQWPEDDVGDLPESAENRVLAALARRHLPPELIGGEPVKLEEATAG